MTECCPTCGQRLPVLDDIAEKAKQMRHWCDSNNVMVDFLGAVSTADAEKLLGYACGTLRNKRSMGDGPPFIRRGRRCRYRLQDLAIYFCGERNEA